MKQALVIKRYNLLDNAHNFINESLICYRRSKKDATVWPFAVFALIQGIELLSKQILKQQHELLVYENIDNPKNTVSLALAVERLSRVSPRLIDEKEKTLLQKALKYRNIILHYEFDLNSKQFKDVYTQLFEFVHYFHHRQIGVELHNQIQKGLWTTEAEIMEYL